MKLKVRSKPIEGESEGDGPVDAAYRAISKAAGVPLKLDDFSITTTGSGADAVGEATVRVRNHSTAIGRGASTDIVLASARAYVDALNKIVARGEEP